MKLSKHFTASRKKIQQSYFIFLEINLLLLPILPKWLRQHVCPHQGGAQREAGSPSSTALGHMTHLAPQASMNMKGAPKKTCKLPVSPFPLSTGRVRGAQLSCSSPQRAHSWPLACWT